MATEINVSMQFEAEAIVPDCLDATPKERVTVVFPRNIEVNFNELTPTQVKPQPEIVTWDADPNKLYTLSNIDPDAPIRENPSRGEMNHWLIVNIKGNDLSTGQTLTPYRGSRAPKNTGLHRYIFLVYEQETPLKFDEKTVELMQVDRSKFSIRKFAEKHNLGDPVAGNFYQAQWDSSVPPSIYDL